MSSFLAGSSNQRHYFLWYTLFIYNQNNFSSSQSSLYYRHRWYWVLVFIEGRKLCWCEIQSLTFCPAKHPTCLLAGVLMTAGEHGIMPGAVERTIFLFTIIQYKCECQHTHTHTHTDPGFGNDYGDGCRLPGPIIPSQILHPPPLETEVHIFFANKVVHALHVCMYCRYARVSVSVCKTRPWFCTCLTLHPQWKSRLATTSFLFMWWGALVYKKAQGLGFGANFLSGCLVWCCGLVPGWPSREIQAVTPPHSVLPPHYFEACRGLKPNIETFLEPSGATQWAS